MGRCPKWQNFPSLRYQSQSPSQSNTIEPSSAEILAYISDLSRDDFIRAIKSADKGYRKYSTSTTFPERGVQLRKWFDLVHQNSEDCILPTHT